MRTVVGTHKTHRREERQVHLGLSVDFSVAEVHAMDGEGKRQTHMWSNTSVDLTFPHYMNASMNIFLLYCYKHGLLEQFGILFPTCRPYGRCNTLHIIGHWRGEYHLLPSNWMIQLQLVGVE